jgi:hypothetical protein
MSPRNPCSILGGLLLVSLSSPVAAAEHEVDGLVIGKTRCEDAIRTVYARDRERLLAMDDVPHEDTQQFRALRMRLMKPRGDGTHYKELYVEASRIDEQADLAAVAKGPEEREVLSKECSPFGYIALHTMVFKALKLDAPVQVDVEALGEKTCPYGSNFISVAVAPHPKGQLLCLDGMVAVYSKQLPTELPKVKAEWTRREGAPRELGVEGLPIDLKTLTVNRFASGAAFQDEDGLVVLWGYGTPPGGPVKVARKRNGFRYKVPKELVFEPTTQVIYLSKAAVDTLERDQRLYDDLAARAAAWKKKLRER